MTSAKDNFPPNFYSGLSGIQLPVPKYLFPEAYKDASRLTYYSTYFNSIEFNSTFYKVPMAKTVEKWAASVPAEFKLTFKLWKEITHVKGLNFKKSDVELFFKAISTAENKKGCILLQFPPGLGGINIRQLDELLQCITENNMSDRWKIAVEFRSRSWYEGNVYELLEFHKAALVIHDIPKSLTPLIDHVSDFIYIRFHGPTGNYRDSYSEAFLSEYACYIKEWLEDGKEVYVYFNNTMGGAFQNLETLNRYVQS